MREPVAHTLSLTRKEQDLIRRYLVWCYKTGKEELDKTDRYFTQAVVDDYLIERLKNLSGYKDSGTSFHRSVEDFIQYAQEKKTRAEGKKFADPARETLQPDYQYIKARVEAIEQAICHFFDQKELERIAALYEQEMTERILKAREHA